MSIIHVNGHTVFANHLTRDSRVLDLGANRGAFAAGIRDRFACECVCVEPNPALRPVLTAQAGLKVVSVALAAQPGFVPFHVSVNSEASSLLGGDLGGWAKSDEIAVEAITLPQILERVEWSTCDLIKMDIEGSEIEVLESCSDTFLQSIPQFTIEFHDFCGITPGADVARVAQRFERLGFSMLS
ncbi:MAG TPA: FkbM family methyltransferase, partial [Vicinamibacterales bacterium]|nr:FkbM family methyltransferase [Vicinamibacterales bacterium]